MGVANARIPAQCRFHSQKQTKLPAAGRIGLSEDATQIARCAVQTHGQQAPHHLHVQSEQPSSASSARHRRIAVYPGTFDPVHKGHLDIARRAANLVDELVVAVYRTPSKNLLFTTDERVQLWREVIAEAQLANVRVEPFDGLIVEF